MRHPTATILTILLIALPFATPAHARDTRLHLPLVAALADARTSGKIDGSVSFHFEGMETPAVLEPLGEATTSRKTSAVGKSDEEACRWAFYSALIALQEAAKAKGANAVIGIRSNYKNQVFSSPSEYECGAGGIMAGVALRGTYAKVAAD